MPLLNPPLVLCKDPEKPEHICRASQRYGIPQGTSGRNGQVIQGIVVHCLDQTLDAYAAQACGDPGRLSRGNGPKASLHYAIGINGVVQQYVDDADIAWGLDFTVRRGTTTPIYRCPAGCPLPDPCDTAAPPAASDPNYQPLWSLTGSNPGVPFDYYLLHVGVEAPTSRVPLLRTGTHNPCGDCSGGQAQARFTDQQTWKLVHLIAYLAFTHNIPLDANHVNFWHNIDPCDREECGCHPCLNNLLCEVNTFCQGPMVAADPSFRIGDNATFIYGQDKFGGKVAETTYDLFTQNLRINQSTGRLEVFNPASNAWEIIPIVMP